VRRDSRSASVSVPPGQVGYRLSLQSRHRGARPRPVMGEDEVCRMDQRPSTADWRTVGRDNTLSLEHLTTGNALQRWGRIR